MVKSSTMTISEMCRTFRSLSGRFGSVSIERVIIEITISPDDNPVEYPSGPSVIALYDVNDIHERTPTVSSKNLKPSS